MDKTVLITGASGLIGKALTTELLKKEYRVFHLNRSANSAFPPEVKVFKWDVYNKTIDKRCIEGVDYIIHLAGEGIAAKAWTNKRKSEIIESRTESIRLIYGLMKRSQHQIKAVISASGVGFYGDRHDEFLTEESPPGTDFLAQSCIAWEKAVDEGKELRLRIVKLRTGVVLSKDGGALPSMAKPIKLGLGTALGSGKQWMPWVHLDDIVSMYIFSIENEGMNGVFNAATPQPVMNKNLTKAIAKELCKPLLLPNVPAFALRLALGEMCAVVLNSTRTSSEKILSAGFRFKYSNLETALSQIYG